MSDTIEIHTEQHTLAPDKDSISFIAYVGGHKVDCVVTSAALARLSDAGKPLSEVFEENRDALGSIAEFMITTNYRRVDGALVIAPEDVDKFHTAR